MHVIWPTMSVLNAEIKWNTECFEGQIFSSSSSTSDVLGAKEA